MSISRRDFLGLATVAILSYLSPLELAAEEKEKVLSDPEILSFYESLIVQLKERKLGFHSQNTFDDFLSVLFDVEDYIKRNNLAKDNLFNLEDLPEDLKKRLDCSSERHKLAFARPDLFEDIDILDTYIEKNALPQSKIIELINKNNAVLFGEVDNEPSCWMVEQTFLDYMLGEFAYADEGFQVHNERYIREYMEGKDSSLEMTVTGMEPAGLGFSLDSKIKRFLPDLRRKSTPVIATDVWVDLQGRISTKFDRDNLISQLYSIREQVFARQIAHAVKKGYRILGSFGDLHLRDHALPKHLEKYGIKPLIITAGNLPLEVYEAAMRVSYGKSIFFKRNDRIIYAAEYTKDTLKKFIFPAEVWKKYDR